MNRIRLLPEHVANQIAAGEVVERPASVVKELVENSLDAEARRITVEIGAGGRSLIRVTDDGCGMSRDDALLCLERHATSKITRAEDLSAIATMGFRGEAIPSIASVSRFSLTTREKNPSAGEGCRVLIQGGRIVEVSAAASPTGTTIEVRQLFFNLPARRKFLRSEETERAHIQHYLVLVALAWPGVGFTLVSDGRTLWQLPPLSWESPSERSTALRERLLQLHGKDTPLLEVDFKAGIEEAPEIIDSPDPLTLRDQGKVSSFRIWGFIGAPGVSRGNRSEQHLFVNQRPVENRGLNLALLEGYHTALMRGRFPVCCLFLEIDPAAVDVNVHPQKREVRFREESAVRRLTAKAVREAIQRFHSGQSAQAAPAQPATVSASPDTRPSTERRAVLPDPIPTPSRPGEPKPAAVHSAGPNRILPESEPAPELPLPSPTVGTRSGSAPSGFPIPVSPPPPPAGPASPPPLLRVPLRLVGVVGRLYVVLESDRGLVLLDQHAAHERILFEQMLARLESGGNAASQRLLLPETVELPARETEFVRRSLEVLGRLGIGLSEFGDRTFLLDGLPPFVRVRSPKAFVLSLIDELQAAGTGVNALRAGEETIAKTVCRHAVKANDPLSTPEVENLIEDLRRCTMPYTCPHGRPTLIEMGWRELEKRFGRTG